jgi:succinate dehydrogenase/fumarate reductase flavoprotein subunit
MRSTVPGLYAAGEAVGGANGANRLSGNAIPEALVFGERAGRAAALARRLPGWREQSAAAAVERMRCLATGNDGEFATAELREELRDVMWRDVGPFRTHTSLSRALERVAVLRAALADVKVAAGEGWNPTLVDWFDLRSSLVAAQAVTRAALAREESRGAHQRDDFPSTEGAWARRLRVRVTSDGTLGASAER